MKFIFKLLSAKTILIIGLTQMLISVSSFFFQEYNYNADWFFKTGTFLSVLAIVGKIFPKGLLNNENTTKN